jgi:hypothetical protein
VFTQVVALVCVGLLIRLLFLALLLSSAMGPHLTGTKLDLVQETVAKGKKANDILALVVAGRSNTKMPPPNIWAIWDAVQGSTDSTHKRGVWRQRAAGRVVAEAVAVAKAVCRDHCAHACVTLGK